ncbi:hypothetical protein ABBQ38_005167 [Trebouxia sp. C0009 RCD-2024]
MYSESRVTRSKARTQGLSQFEQLPLTCAKGRTTTRKHRDRPAFFDVTNAEQSIPRKESSSPVKNLTADFQPSDVETDSAGALSETSLLSQQPSEPVQSQDAFGLDTVLKEAGEQSASPLHKATSAEADTIPALQASDPGSAVQDAVKLVADIDEDTFAGDQGTTVIIAKVAIHKSALYVYMRPKLGESGVCARRQFLKLAVVLQEADIAVSTVDDGDDLGSIAAAPTQAQQSPLYNSITEAPLSPQDRKDEGFSFNTPDVNQASTPGRDTTQCASAGTPKACDSSPPVSETLSSTPATIRQPILPEQSATPDVPDTVVASQMDSGYLLADSSSPKAVQSSPLGAASATNASPCQTSPNSAVPASGGTGAAGLLDVVYFSAESDPEMTDTVDNPEHPLVASMTSPDKPAAPTVEVQGVDIIDAVYLSEADTDSAEDIGELNPFELIGESPQSPRSSASSGKDADDTTGSPDLMQSPLTPAQPSSPAAGAAYMPALESTMPSGAFGSPMQQAPASVARTAVSPAPAYRKSPATHDDYPTTGSAAGDDRSPLTAGKSSLVPDYTEGLDDRWQMEEETAPVFSNIHVADVPATRVSSQVHASPSYDPRSLRQLKKEVADKLAKKAAAAKAKAEMAVPPPTPAGLYESESDVEMSPSPVSTKHIKGVDDDELCDALGSLEIQSAGKSKEPLRGLPVPQGMHIRFDNDGHAMVSPSSTQTRLRGVPAPRNSHIRFD